jgi:NarL family two-component system response regulator LiaR
LPSSDFKVKIVELSLTPGVQLPDGVLGRFAAHVFDSHSPVVTTRALISQLTETLPGSRIVVLAERFSETNAFPLLNAGVKGLVTYSEMERQLPSAVRLVSAGGYWVPRNLLSRFVDTILRAQRTRPTLGHADLSARETEILTFLLDNLSNKEIGNRLNISERTVKFHVSNVLSKFGVGRRADLVLLWYQDRARNVPAHVV